jgi:membrane protein required for beta-lactamase induction
MNELILFAGSVGLSFLAWGVVCARYLWPWLKQRSLAEAVKPLLLLHAFRFVGVAFVVPGVVSPALQSGFAVPAAYGDLVAAVLAWVAYAATPGPMMLPGAVGLQSLGCG